MARWCETTKRKVLYLECLECDENCPNARRRAQGPVASGAAREDTEAGERPRRGDNI